MTPISVFPVGSTLRHPNHSLGAGHPTLRASSSPSFSLSLEGFNSPPSKSHPGARQGEAPNAPGLLNPPFLQIGLIPPLGGRWGDPEGTGTRGSADPNALQARPGRIGSGRTGRPPLPLPAAPPPRRAARRPPPGPLTPSPPSHGARPHPPARRREVPEALQPARIVSSPPARVSSESGGTRRSGGRTRWPRPLSAADPAAAGEAAAAAAAARSVADGPPSRSRSRSRRSRSSRRARSSLRRPGQSRTPNQPSERAAGPYVAGGKEQGRGAQENEI